MTPETLPEIPDDTVSFVCVCFNKKGDGQITAQKLTMQQLAHAAALVQQMFNKSNRMADIVVETNETK